MTFHNPFRRTIIKYKSIIPLHVQYALNEIGVTEYPGEGSNPRIVEYLSVVGFNDEKYGWCSAFLCWSMAGAGLKHTGSALARSWLEWGSPVETPQLGDICVFKRGIDPLYGHCAIYLDMKDGLITVLGGNQGNAVRISRYYDKQLLGYRRINII